MSENASMTRGQILAAILKLDTSERLDLIGDVWDSIDSKNLPLTPAQAAEVERRMADIERNPDLVISWEELRAELRAQFG